VTNRTALYLGVLAVLCLATVDAQMDPVEADIALWSLEVHRHVPGTADDHAKTLAQWPWDRLGSILGRFFVNDRVPDTTLLLRATVAYGDIALFVPREQRPVYPGLYTGSDRVTLEKDGRPVGETWRDTHLRIAHEILRRVVRAPQSREEEKAFAAAWYVAMAAWLARDHDLAGLKDHLEEAREQFPRHAEIQFLSGCWAESIASPAVQAALPAPETKRPSQVKPFGMPQQNVLARSTNRALAENKYRRALEIDPRHEEARVRLARILTLDGDGDRAVPLLEPAPLSADPVLRYYRLLFLGRAYERTNRLDKARASFDAASRLFPGAQSPWLAMSALAATAGDSEAWKAALERVLNRTEPFLDPWWAYDDCSGRNAGRIYGDFVQQVHQFTLGNSTRLWQW
jgi:tetratricopeptide (TPR) repeat protein